MSDTKTPPLSPGPNSPFLWVACQPGAEKALKGELAREHRDLRFAFSRPGFVTFRSPTPLDIDFELSSVFARAYGLSHGRFTGVAGAEGISWDTLVTDASRWANESGFPLHGHLFERPQFVNGEEPLSYVPGAWLGEARAAFEKGGWTLDAGPTKHGQIVVDLILVEDGEIWLGAHRQLPPHTAFPGGVIPVTLPEGAPSRAYLKLEEAIRCFDLPLRSGDHAIEVGASPGGAVFALLERGLKVVGIDPAAMDPGVVKKGGDSFMHLPFSAYDIQPEDLPEKMEWLLLDMNADPRISLKLTERIVAMIGDQLLGVIFTLKLNRWGLAVEVPEWIEQTRSMGMTRVRALQLSSNKQEICVTGLTRRGLLRVTGAR